MQERKLAELFFEFLEKEKQYPSKSLLKDARISTSYNTTIRPDLVIIDSKSNNFIALIEFKSDDSPEAKRTTSLQIKKYLRVLKDESLPSYFVTPSETKGFKIHILNDEGFWTSISKKEFPEFETLLTKKSIEEKEFEKEVERLNISEKFAKQIRKQKTSLWTLFSLVAGILTVILSFYTSSDLINRTDEIDIKKYQLEIQNLKTNLTLTDSIRILSSKSINDTIFVIDTTRTYSGIDNRLSIIEEGLLNNPSKTLKIENIYDQIHLLEQDIKHQNELIQANNSILKARVDLLNALVLGMIIASFSAAIGYVITNNINKKNNH